MQIYDLSSKLKDIIITIFVSLSSSYIWEYIIKPFILGPFPALSFLDGFLVGLIVFFIIFYIQVLPTDPKSILDKGDRDLMKFLINERARIDRERLRVEHDSQLWHHYTNQMSFVEKRINHIERRIHDRQTSE